MAIAQRLLRRAKRLLGSAVGSVTVNRPLVALTFDDGPDPRYTSDLLRILGKYGAQATFFMVGARAQQHPDLVKEVFDAGHAIGNHSYDHPSFPEIGVWECIQQIRRCSKILGHHESRICRPPFGHQSTGSYWCARLLGYEIVTWSSIPGDWVAMTSQEIAQRIVDQLNPGGIVLLHDSLFCSSDPANAGDRQPTLDGVELVLERLSGSYEFVTVPHLMREGKPVYRSWQRSGDSEYLEGLQSMG